MGMWQDRNLGRFDNIDKEREIDHWYRFLQSQSLISYIVTEGLEKMLWVTSII